MPRNILPAGSRSLWRKFILFYARPYLRRRWCVCRRLSGDQPVRQRGRICVREQCSGHSRSRHCFLFDGSYRDNHWGAGSGYYVPCLTKTGATANGSQQNSVAIFFNVSAPYNAPGPCVGLESQYWIPFVFGVPQTHFLALSPDAFPFLGGGFASSQDSFTGFVALDLLGNRLTGVTIDFGQLPSPSVPEPNAGLMVLTGIAAVLAVGQRIPLRQRRAGWSPLNRSRNRGGKG